MSFEVRNEGTKNATSTVWADVAFLVLLRIPVTENLFECALTISIEAGFGQCHCENRISTA